MTRIRAAVILLVLVVAALTGTSSASADEEPTTTTTLLPGAVAIDVGYAFTGAVISTPGDAAPRAFDAYHAAVFVQSWLGEAFFGKPLMQGPPPELPVSRIDVTGTWGDLSGTLTVYYASDGTTPWVSFPQDQTPSTAPSTPPAPSNWFVAPPRVVDAFNGTAKLEDTAGVRSATSIPTTTSDGTASAPGGSGSSTSLWWALAAAAGVVAVLGGGRWLRRRRA